MPEIEPFPEALLPKSMRGLYKGELARHMYRYRVTSRGPAREILREFEERKRSGRKVAFSFHDLIFYFAKIAAEGIIGNVAYAVIARLAQKVRTPLRELIRSDVEFVSVVPKDTYGRLRKLKHAGKRPLLKAPDELEQKVETHYNAMIPRRTTTRRKHR